VCGFVAWVRCAGAVRAASPARFRLWGRAAKEDEAADEAAAAPAMVQVRAVMPNPALPSSPLFVGAPPHASSRDCREMCAGPRILKKSDTHDSPHCRCGLLHSSWETHTALRALTSLSSVQHPRIFHIRKAERSCLHTWCALPLRSLSYTSA